MKDVILGMKDVIHRPPLRMPGLETFVLFMVTLPSRGGFYPMTGEHAGAKACGPLNSTTDNS